MYQVIIYAYTYTPLQINAIHRSSKFWYNLVFIFAYSYLIIDILLQLFAIYSSCNLNCPALHSPVYEWRRYQ